jgi:hypothetical protein
MVRKMRKEYIDKNEVLRMIAHEEDTHVLIYSKEAYHRIYEMVGMMRPKCYSCSNCNEISIQRYKNCPNCGADMSKD